MARKLQLVKRARTSAGPVRRSVLVYGMRLIDAGQITAVDDARIKLNDGGTARVTMHLLEGSHLQIRRQLMQSIDAFFELYDEDR
jgi:hypothetical protein